MKEPKPLPPTFYKARLQSEKHPGSTTNVGVWAYSYDEAADQMVTRFPGHKRPDPVDFTGTQKFTWSDGRVMSAVLKTSREEAEINAETWRSGSEGQKVSVRIIPRSVRAGKCTIPCWAVIVRHRWER